MEKQEEKIIVLDCYDNVIMANLVKTKLDAYGIPCFITNENFTSLYPISNEIFPGARIHIFNKDLMEAQQVLIEEDIIARDELYSCPKCQSKNVVFEVTEKSGLWKSFRVMVSILIFMPAAPGKKIYQCKDCSNQFDMVA